MPLEISEHFIIDVPKVKSNAALVNKLDVYDVARRNFKRMIRNP